MLSFALFWGSALLAVSLTLWLAVTKRARTWPVQAVVVLAPVGIVAYFMDNLAPSDSVTKGPSDDSTLAIIWLYACMALGMGAHYFYDRFSVRASRRRKFDWGTLLQPIFISPCVFLPLLAALLQAGVDLRESGGARLMLFFVAFEQGFLWQGFAQKKLASHSSAASD